MLRNFCHFLQQRGLLRHALILTIDEGQVPW